MVAGLLALVSLALGFVMWSAGTAWAQVGIPPSFPPNAQVADLSLTRGVSYTGLALPEATGADTPLTYSVSPTLPAGLSLDDQRRITGKPTGFQAQTAYNYIATDSDGDTASLPFNITIAANLTPTFGSPAPTIADKIYIINVALTPLQLPAASGGDGALAYSVNPALPAGLTLNTDSAHADFLKISGTPTTASAPTAYTLTATDTDGDTASLTFNIAVAAESVPSFGSQTGPDQSLNQGLSGAFTLPSASGGNGALAYTVTPDLPEGLTFNQATRAVSGIPAAFQARTEYTLTASDSDVSVGSADEATLAFHITIAAATPTQPTLTATAGAGKVKLEWTGGGYRNGWEYAQSTSSTQTGTWTAVPDSDADTALFWVTGLVDGTTYHFKARGVNGSGGNVKGAESAQASATPDAALGTDYDSDDDGLIEVGTLARLNAIRWDLEGTGAPAIRAPGDARHANETEYLAAFPDPEAGMGCNEDENRRRRPGVRRLRAGRQPGLRHQRRRQSEPAESQGRRHRLRGGSERQLAR